ncbi:hypothetical protein RYX36_004386 [Vicia faba]
MVYPDDLYLLLGKKMAFRVKVQPTFGQSSMWKLSCNEEFVKKVQNDFIPNVQSLSAFGENDPDTNCGNTPAKDIFIGNNVEDIDCEVYGATQFSDTKPSKKVKMESYA